MVMKIIFSDKGSYTVTDFYRAALNAGRSGQEKVVCLSVSLSVRLSIRPSNA